MLTRRALAGLTLAGAISLPGATAALANPPAPTDGQVICERNRCQLVATSPGTPARRTPSRPVNAPRSSTGGTSSPGGASSGGGSWKPLTKQQLINATAWDYRVNTLCATAQATGRTLPAECRPAAAVPAQKAAKAAPAPPIFTPADATKRALSQLTLARPDIGSAPCHEPGCRGSVGIPVWLWTTPWRSQSATATAGPFTVTASATPTAVTWDLGDGQRFTCHTPGTPYDVSLGWRDSPDCGSRYSRVGTYAITATMTYSVTWTGADTGTQTMTTSSSVPVYIGDIQVVATH